MINYERHILALDDVELEKFVREWADQQKVKYLSVKRFAGAGDMGRDVVGFTSNIKHDGDWVNYQCKQYGKSVPTDKGMLEIGKILYYAYKKEFTVPTEYFFVAPKGINRNLESYIFKPETFKIQLITNWDKYCKSKIIQKTDIPLTDQLKDFIESYDFSTIDVIDIDTIVSDLSFRNILVDWFGGEILPPPDSQVPTKIQDQETKYIEKILCAYSEHDGTKYLNVDDLNEHDRFKIDLEIQRERYFSADAFNRFYRDNTAINVLDSLKKQIFNGVYDISQIEHKNAYICMCSVMSQASNITPTGKLAIHAKVDVRQGYCHHFANKGELNWNK